MSGICGLFSTSGKSDVPTVSKMSKILRHRGPDDEGYVAISTHDGAAFSLGGTNSQNSLPDIAHFEGPADLFLGHRRLFVADQTSAGHQPLCYADEDLWITFDGRLYNSPEIRRRLEKLGYSFRSLTDAEVLLAAYKEWGEGCLQYFDGMWSFVLYDRKRNRLFGARDRFGVKPLYYVNDSSYFAFASEAKAFSPLPDFRRAVRQEAVFDYLAFGVEHWDDGSTFLEEVSELPPAHAFSYDLSQKVLNVRRYYSLPWQDGVVWEPFCRSMAAEHVERVKELVFASVRRRITSGAPLGCCVSGGIDSSSIFGVIGALAKDNLVTGAGEKAQAFTVCFDDASVDESTWARLAAEHGGGEWHTVYPRGDELIVDLEDLVYTQDFPFGSTSIYAQYRLMKLAKERGIRVLLDGQGGDELFTGYTPYYTAFFREMLQKSAWRDLAREWRELDNAPTGKKSVMKGMLIGALIKHLPRSVKQLGYIRHKPLLKFVSPELKERHLPTALDRLAGRIYDRRLLNEMLFCMMTSTSLPNLLRYEDRNAARFQVESRTPFADAPELIEEVFSIPAVYKIHGGYSKWLLRESMRGVLPEAIYRRRDKIGFQTPEKNWLQPKSGDFKSLIVSNLAEFLDVEKISGEWNILMENGSDKSNFPVWRLINLALWIR